MKQRILITLASVDPWAPRGINEVTEGVSRGTPFIAEFPSYEAALECYRSPGYQAAIAMREGAAEFDVVVVQGATPTG